MPYARKDQIVWLPNHYYHIYNRGARQVTLAKAWLYKSVLLQEQAFVSAPFLLGAGGVFDGRMVHSGRMNHSSGVTVD